MAITMMCDKSVPGAFPSKWNGESFHMVTTHEGCVLSVSERNYYDDSDFVATIWDAAAGQPREIIYATTRGWTYPNSATVDVTPEVRAAYEAWVDARNAARAAADAKAAAARPAKGKMLRVVKGRKVPVGTVGACVWYGAGKFGPRVGIKDAEGTVHWTDAGNVAVVE